MNVTQPHNGTPARTPHCGCNASVGLLTCGARANVHLLPHGLRWVVYMRQRMCCMGQWYNQVRSARERYALADWRLAMTRRA